MVREVWEPLARYSRLLVVGSGGVGKTTMAASLGVDAAVSFELRVLVVTVDPAKRLASSLGVGPLANTPVEIKLPASLEPRGKLFAASVDMKRAWDSLIEKHSPDAATQSRILASPIYHNLSSKFIGSYDYAAVEVLASLTAERSYDVVIVDTPPSRNALDFLDAPRRLREFFSSNLLALLTLPRRTRVFSLATRPFYLVAEAIMGGAFLSDLTDFFTDFSRLRDGLVAQSVGFSDLLTQEETGFIVVSDPYGPSVVEAERLLTALARRGIHEAAWFVNRSWPARLFSEEAETAARWLGSEGLELLLDQAGSELDRSIARRTVAEVIGIRDQIEMAHSRETLTRIDPSVPIFEIPIAAEELVDAAALARLVATARRFDPS